MPRISRKYPGKTDGEIFTKVDAVMEGIARRHSLDYRKNPDGLGGAVSKLGATGTFAVRSGEVTVDLKFPILIPGSMRRKVEEDIERKLEELFA
jgi:hypothetical protein